MTDTPAPEDGAEIRLTPDEAIVLFDLLSRWSGSGDDDTPKDTCFENTAECAVLHGLLGELEKQLVAPFKPNYGEMVDAARGRLAGNWDGATLRA
ncbi:hypothetical protein [Sphingomonas sp.]|uniref:hypothetical protein n=1 Tax=Sphingomonas sp. TaxID=28214 RepID=UPI0025D10F60|nr:hypothetical protein [Sphingomonas sp.]